MLRALAAGSIAVASASYTPILGYSPGTQVDDHARIDLDQAAIESALKTPDFVKAKAIYQTGIYSKPSAVCTVAASGTLLQAASKSDKVYFEANNGNWIEGKSYTSYAATDTAITFTYPVDESQIIYDYTAKKPNEPSTGACWVGDGTGITATATNLCIKGSTTSTTSTFVIGTGTKGATGCTTGASGGFTTCTSVSAQITATCTNQGKRTLQGFSTAAKKKMYDATMSSSDCPAPDPTKAYPHGCPYTSFVPYWNYYCAATTSSCHASGDYANQLVLAALDQGSTATFNYAGSDFSKVTDTKARVEMIKKGTAYMNAWMYAIREFEDAIDDCVSGTPTNTESTGPVHAWDEGVAFFVGSAMQSVLEMFSRPDGFLAYTLGNKRCVNYKTCGVDGDSKDKQQAKANTDLYALFTDGQQKLVTGDCAGAVPVKNKIVEAMTVPLVQGTLRYAHKMTYATAPGPKEAGEGAIFAQAVLPQLHACDPAAAATVNKHTNIDNFYGAKDYNYKAVKAAFEGCYSKIFATYADPCKEIGGLWDGTSAYMTDASPCAPPSPPAAAAASGLSTGGLVGIIVAAVVAVLLLILVLVMCNKEKEGKPIFAPVAGAKA